LIIAILISATHAKAALIPEKVIKSLLDEFEQLGIEERKLKVSENALTAATGCGKSCSKGNSSGVTKPYHTDAECWKCRQKGHN